MSKTSKDPGSKQSEHAAAPNTKLQAMLPNAIQVFADYSVYDTVANKYLVEGKDYDSKNLFRI